jgi:predicted outer membrane repeat protein
LAFCIEGGSNVSGNVSTLHKTRAGSLAAIDTFYVSPSGSNTTGNGSENQPWRSLKFALSQLQADSLNPKVIKLANGTYSAGATGEKFPINLKSWISIAGSDSLATIIQSNKSARALVGENIAHVVISGLTIRNGFAESDAGDSSRGGGLWLRDCRQLTLRNCVIRDNEAKTLGGGVFLSGGAEINFENNRIENNRASDGAGIYCSKTANARLLANFIQRNAASNSGGGVYIEAADPVLQRNRIRWNSASTSLTKNAGGIMLNAANAVIGGALETGNDIHDNIGGSTGAQLYIIENKTQIDARFNYWGAAPSSDAIQPLSLTDYSNYRNLSITVPLGTTDFHVSPAGSDQNNGSASAPWRTIGYALSQIYASILDSLTIILAPGTYSVASNGEQFPLSMKSHITLIGAANPDIGAIASRQSEGDATVIIDGKNTIRELFRLEDVVDARLANLIIRNANANTQWGALLARDSETLVLDHCIFEDNQSLRGAAITFINVDNSQILDNVFRRNRSTGTGGALALLYDGSTLLNNLFTENSATVGGGAVHCDSSSETRIQSNEFQKNTAGAGGALYITRSNPRVYSNLIILNHANVSGGGAIALDGASLPFIGTRDSQANDIYLNTAVGAGSQLRRLDVGLKVDARGNYWGQAPDTTMSYPAAEFATENFRQVATRLPASAREVYISPAGNDAASGVSPQQPLRTISQSLLLVFGTPQSPITLRLLPGRFAASTNGETFPVALESHVTLRGAGRDSTTLDAEGQSRVFEGWNVIGSVIADLNITGGFSSEPGGAVLLQGATAASTINGISTTIENCLLQKNSTKQHGGAVAAIRNRKTVIRGCVFAENSAQRNGGAVLALGDSIEISQSEFHSNQASISGGAVGADSAAVLTLINNRIHDNIANRRGGGMVLLNSSGRIWRNFIIDNWAQTGAGGGIFLEMTSTAVIGGSPENGNDIYGNRSLNPGTAIGSSPRSDYIDTRFNYFGSTPDASIVGAVAVFDVSKFRYVTIQVPENSREFYLSPQGNDGNSGVAKTSAWRTLTAAFRRFFTAPGDSVRLYLLNGTYSTSTTGENFPVRFPSRASLIGQSADSAVFDCDGKTRLFEIANATQVHFRNLTIANGNNTVGATPQAYSAGGVQIHKSAFVDFDRVAFRRNKTNRDGGAVAADSSNAVFFRQCRFLENYGRGAGIFFNHTSGEIRGCEFRQNRSPNRGSALFLANASAQVISNTIVGNVSEAIDVGGAVFCAGATSPVFGGAPGQGNDIYNNSGGVVGIMIARDARTPVINAMYNYLGLAAPGEAEVYPLDGFDLRFSREVPITKNSAPVVAEIKPPANAPLYIGLADTIRFEISAYDPDNDALTHAWTLDNSTVPVSYGTQYLFYPTFLGLGEHRVRVVVSDQREIVTVDWQLVIGTTGVNERGRKLPATYELQQNFPNPLRSAPGMTVIPFQIPQRNEVLVEIYDLLGRRVRLLEHGQKPPGFYTAAWDGRDHLGQPVESGIYFVRLQAGEFTAMRKVVVTR